MNLYQYLICCVLQNWFLCNIRRRVWLTVGALGMFTYNYMYLEIGVNTWLHHSNEFFNSANSGTRLLLSYDVILAKSVSHW